MNNINNEVKGDMIRVIELVDGRVFRLAVLSTRLMFYNNLDYFYKYVSDDLTEMLLHVNILNSENNIVKYDESKYKFIRFV